MEAILMAKFEFKKDPSRKKHKHIQETEIIEPTETFSLEDFSKQKEKEEKEKKKNEKSKENSKQKKMGRPRKGKIYSTIRIQRKTVHRINAIQNCLQFPTQDDLIDALLDKAEAQFDAHQNDMYRMYMLTYKAKDERKNNQSY